MLGSGLAIVVSAGCRLDFFKEKGGGGGGSHTEPNRGYSPDCCVDLHALLLLM